MKRSLFALSCWLLAPVAFAILDTNNNGVSVTWPTLVGKQYTLLFSPDLTEGSWIPVDDPFIGTGDDPPFGFDVNDSDKRFWRVAVGDVDSDSDGLNDYEEHLIGTYPLTPETFGGIPDAWLALYYNTADGFDPNDDDDNDGLSNFEEYLHGTNPKKADTDGDETPDADEVNQGSNPNDISDGGAAPSDLLKEVAFTVGGDYASWRMEIHAKGPRDQRILRLASQNPGDTETRTFKLHRNNRYEITLYRTGGVEDWYCWEAAVDSKPEAVTFDSGQGYYQLEARNSLAHFFTVASHWLVDNRQGLLTSHLHSYQNDVASPLKAELIPVAIEDNIEATGVDIVSNSVASEVPGYQDKLWVMAPIAGPPPPSDYSNEMKFHIPLNPAADLAMECDHATPDPATITLNNGKPAVLWRGSGDNQTNENTTTFKIGAHEDEVDLPIGVMTMKHRTVKVAVYLVRRPESRPFPTFDEGLLLNELNKVFAYQMNSWFDLKFYSKTISYDTNLNRILIVGDESGEFSGPLADPQIAAADPEFNPDIKVLLIDDIQFYGVVNPPERELSPLVGYTPPGTVCVVKVGTAYTDESDNPQVLNKDPALVRQNVAHEIGHIMLGEGHPDEGDGPASLSSLQPDLKRLMYSGIDGISNSVKLLVKGEWDGAESWLSLRSNDDN